MRPIYHPQLVNDPFGDPALYVDCLFEKRAVLFDLGDLHRLPSRKILRVSHIFVSHAHMDHFVGFDRVLRTCLGRDKQLHLFGPQGFISQVRHKLAGYTWNLVGNYDSEFILTVTEIQSQYQACTARFRCESAFQYEGSETGCLNSDVILEEETFCIRAAILDHNTPCLAFSLEEKQHVNIWKNRLDEMGLPTGPWLRDLKQAVLRGAPEDMPIKAWWRDSGVICEKSLPLGELIRHVLRVVAGQKLTYVVDAIYTKTNIGRILKLARNADLLYIETPFLQQDLPRAWETYHLTAHQAGLIARDAKVKRLIPFHFSPKYSGAGHRLVEEADKAFHRPSLE